MPNPQKRKSKRTLKQLTAKRNQIVLMSTNQKKKRRNRVSSNTNISNALFPRLHSHSLDYVKSLRDPWSYRQVRLPTLYSVATQAHCCHGNLTFSANANGFARLSVNPFECSYILHNDATHTENVLGTASTILLPGAPSYANSASRYRLVSAGLIIRSTSSFSTEAGLMQTFVTFVGPNVANYDVYRDSPHVFPYSKGQTAEVVYLPFMPRCFDLLSSGEINTSFTNFYMGVMISGAAGVSYSVQYAINYEMVQSTNTDLVPLKTNPVADTHELLKLVGHNSPVNKEWTLKSYASDKLFSFTDGISRLGYSLMGANSPNGFFRNVVKPLAGNEAILFAK